jgi:hypothetical protein
MRICCATTQHPPQKLTSTSTTSGRLSVGIIRLRTKSRGVLWVWRWNIKRDIPSKRSLENVGASTSHNSVELHVLLQGELYLSLFLPYFKCLTVGTDRVEKHPHILPPKSKLITIKNNFYCEMLHRISDLERFFGFWFRTWTRAGLLWTRQRTSGFHKVFGNS